MPLLRATVLMVMAALGAAGCGQPHANIQYMTGGPDENILYDSTTFQLAKDQRIQIVLFRRTAAPIGTADADFEFVFFELPERDRYGWLKEDHVPAYRWVRESGKDHLWQGVTGQVSLWAGDFKQHIHFDFRVTMEPLAETGGGAYVLSGSLRAVEDMVTTQGLLNRYGDWLLSLLGQTPKEPAGPKLKLPGGSSKTKHPGPSTQK